jgi:hypothetical protein
MGRLNVAPGQLDRSARCFRLKQAISSAPKSTSRCAIALANDLDAMQDRVVTIARNRTRPDFDVLGLLGSPDTICGATSQPLTRTTKAAGAELS